MVSYIEAADSTDCTDRGIPRQSENVTPSRNVCRNLFGTTIDHNDFLEETKKRNIERLQEKTQQYNFDFEKDQPLPGRYLWEKVSNFGTRNCNKLTIQSKPILKRRNSKAFSKTDSKTNGKSLKSHEEYKITDYFRSKKRRYEDTTEKDHTEMNNFQKVQHTTQEDMTKACVCLNRCQCT